MKYDVVSLGGIYLDINCTDFPFGEGLLPETETVGNKYQMLPGGSALNFSRSLLHLGAQPAFIGKKGNDYTGELLERMLELESISSLLITSHEVQTNIGFNMINEGKTLMTVLGSANQSLDADDVQSKLEEALPDAKYLYLGSAFKMKSLIPYYQDFVDLAIHHNVPVVLDHGRITNDIHRKDRVAMRALIKDVDIYMPSNDEFLDLFDAVSLDRAAESASTLSDVRIVVKRGSDGATGYDGRKHHIPAYNVEPKYLVGAGDSFNAGFIRGQLQGLGFADSIEYGCASAALKITMPGLPNSNSVEEFIAYIKN
ncbi:hypothetical protein H6504_05260 [Candidatus Woesearchaeota archaeon]|nr:hypothetical protein [Candidatus Woesearchaeota archaeon]